jgi:hypothetical protein
LRILQNLYSSKGEMLEEMHIFLHAYDTSKLSQVDKSPTEIWNEQCISVIVSQESKIQVFVV